MKTCLWRRNSSGTAQRQPASACMLFSIARAAKSRWLATGTAWAAALVQQLKAQAGALCSTSRAVSSRLMARKTA